MRAAEETARWTTPPRLEKRVEMHADVAQIAQACTSTRSSSTLEEAMRELALVRTRSLADRELAVRLSAALRLTLSAKISREKELEIALRRQNRGAEADAVRGQIVRGQAQLRQGQLPAAQGVVSSGPMPCAAKACVAADPLGVLLSP
eukprot:792869-Pleurochrysis_carterae.AAC.1